MMYWQEWVFGAVMAVVCVVVEYIAWRKRNKK